MTEEHAYIEFRTHAVSIIRTDSDIRCFKFAPAILRSDYEVFGSEDDAVEYIITPFPDGYYTMQECE